ncbi:MAG: hypothetical protein R3C68_14865 [Myxococcota bacterium]
MTNVQAHLERLAQEPAEPAALQAVEEAFRGEGRWEELLRVYEDNALRADKAAAGPLLRKAAMICVNELASAPRAEVYLKRSLDVTPSDVETLHALRSVYLTRGDYEKGLEVYEKELSRTADAAQKSKGWVEVADIYSDKLQRFDKALAALKQANRADKNNPAVHRVTADIYEAQGRLDQAHAALIKELEIGGGDTDLYDRLARLAQRLLERPKLHEHSRNAIEAVLRAQSDHELALSVKEELESYATSWQGRIEELEHRVAEVKQEDPEKAAELWLSVAEIQLVYGEQVESALMSIDRAVAAQPGHAASLRLMEDLYGSQNRWDELAIKLEMMASYTRDPAGAVALYLKAAMHYAVRLDNPDAAARLYERVLEVDPGNKIASNTLAEYYRERREWENALKVLTVWAERATSAGDKVAAYYACCRIIDEEIGDRVRAKPYYEAILSLDPENQAAARALEKVYRESKDHAALARVLYAKLAGLSGEERIPVLEELGGLFAGPLQQPADAFATYGELYRARPEPELRQRLVELAAQTGAYSSLVQFIEAGLENVEDVSGKIDALHVMADLYEGPRDAPLEALQVHRRVLALAPDDAKAQEGIERLLEAAAASTDKVAFYYEQAEAASSEEEKVKILHKLATELVDTNKDYVRAIDVYRQILQIVPEDAEALELILVLYRRDTRWAEVADILTRKLESLEGRAKNDVRLELASIMEQHLDQVDAAVDHYVTILDADNTHEDAIHGLERLLSRTKRVLQVAEHLEPLYLAREDWARAADMGEIRVREETRPAKRVEILRALAKLYDHRLSRPVYALAALLRAFQADPASADLDELERIAQGAGAFAGVIRSYRAASLSVEGAARRELLLRSGRLSESQGDQKGASVDYLKATALTDGEDRRALEGLARLVAAGGDAYHLDEIAAEVGANLDPHEAANMWRCLAGFFDADLSAPEQAIHAWNSVLSLQPNDKAAQIELDRLYESAGDASDLVNHLRNKLELAHDDASRVAIRRKVSEVLAGRLNDVDGAIIELSAIVEMIPGDREAWQQIAVFQRQQGRPSEAAQAMLREINLLSESAERQAALVRYAGLLGKELNDFSGALRALQSVLAAAPAYSQAIDLLEELTQAGLDPQWDVQFGAMLLAAYEAAESYEKFSDLLSRRVDAIRIATSGLRLCVV